MPQRETSYSVDRRTRRELLGRLAADAGRIADRFGLEYRALEAERSNVTSRYGICYEDGTIKIRLNHASTREPLKYSSLVNTLCHELAHLRHFNHGARFKAFYLELLGWARQQGIYQPGRRQAAPQASRQTAGHTTRPATLAGLAGASGSKQPVGPLQLDLFG